MNVVTERLDTQEALMTVSVAAEEVEKAKREAAKRIALQVNIPGFRKGKAPYTRIVQLFGDKALLEEALEDLGQKVYSDALDQSDLEPYAPGTLEKVETAPELVLTFKVPLQPEVDLGAYREVRVLFEGQEVSDEAVNEFIENLRAARALIEPVDRPADWGDVVTLDIFGELLPAGQERLDAETEVEPENRLIDEEMFEFVLDAERDFLPGFAAQLIGITAGAGKTFTLDIPGDYENEQLRGRRAAFELDCTRVSARTLPALNDTFAADVTGGEHETLLELRLALRRILQKQADQKAEEPYFDAVMDKVLEGARLAYPPMMIDEYVDRMLVELDQDLRRRNGITLEDYLRIQNQTREELAKEMREAAERRLRRALVLGKVVEVEELEPSDEALSDEIEALVKEADEQGEQLRAGLQRSEARHDFRLRLMTRWAIERLIAIAKGENPPKGPKPKLHEKLHSEYVTTLDDFAEQVAGAAKQGAEEAGKLFPGERVEGGIVRID